MTTFAEHWTAANSAAAAGAELIKRARSNLTRVRNVVQEATDLEQGFAGALAQINARVEANPSDAQYVALKAHADRLMAESAAAKQIFTDHIEAIDAMLNALS